MPTPENLSAARLRLVSPGEFPYFAAAVWAVKLIPVPDLATMAPGPVGVDAHLNLYYDPDVCDTFDVGELAGILYHEIAGHVLADHARRGEAMQQHDEAAWSPLLWNLAGDLEINDRADRDLANTRTRLCRLPANAIRPKTFTPPLPGQLLAETYYEHLLRRRNSKPMQDHDGHHCGSCARPDAAPWEVATESSDTVSTAEVALVRRRVAEDVQRHVATADRNRGTVPDWIVRWASTILSPRIPWQRVLAASIRSAIESVRGRVDYRYGQVSRRQAVSPIILPSMIAPRPRVGIQIDTSGSMGERDLARALAEVDGCLRQTDAEVLVMAVDAAASAAKRIVTRRDVTLTGGGGTDMGVGLEAWMRTRPQPHLVVVITDGETPWPKVGPPFQVIVALTRSSRSSSPPSWARTIHLYEGDNP